MKKVIRDGYTVRVSLPEECGYEGYSVKCTYKAHENDKDKYYLSMWLKHDNTDDDFKIDTQCISGNPSTIVKNICRIVDYASLSGFFDKYIKKLEYNKKCFMYGKEVLESKDVDES